MRVHLLAPAAVAVAGLLASACQTVPPELVEAAPIQCPSDSTCYDPPAPDGPGGHLEVETGEFYFEILSGQAAEGTVTITLDNVGGAEHTFTIDEAFGDVKEVLAAPGAVEEGELQLFAGNYVYYCSIPGHRSQGMEGTLQVVAPGDEIPTTGTSESPDPGEEGGATPGEGGPPEGSETPVEPPDVTPGG